MQILQGVKWNGTVFNFNVCLDGYQFRNYGGLTMNLAIAIISILLVVAIGLGTLEVLLDE